MGRAFGRLEASTPRGAQASKSLHDAMRRLSSPAWKDMLVERISVAIVKPTRHDDSGLVSAYRNQLFWQTTSAEILGDLGDASAVKALLKIVITPSKAELFGPASLAIVKIGNGAVPILLRTLAGGDTEMIEYARSLGPQKPEATCMWGAAIVLGGMGRPDTARPMTRALSSADSELTRAVLARELTKFPGNPERQRAFRTAFEQVSPTTRLPSGETRELNSFHTPLTSLTPNLYRGFSGRFSWQTAKARKKKIAKRNARQRNQTNARLTCYLA